MADGKRTIPATRPSHLMCLEGVELGLGEIRSPCNVTLRPQFRKPRESIDEVLIPSPRHYSAKVRPHFVRSAAWVPRLSRYDILVAPVQQLANLFPAEVFRRHRTSPPRPLAECRGGFFAGSLCWVARAEVLRDNGFECRRHRWSPAPPATPPCSILTNRRRKFRVLPIRDEIAGLPAHCWRACL
jgi:hypothetical protein